MPRSTVRECTRTRVTKNWNARRRWDRVSFDIYSIAAKVREHSRDQYIIRLSRTSETPLVIGPDARSHYILHERQANVRIVRDP